VQMVVFREDKAWEIVLEALSSQGRLARYQKMPRHDLTGILKQYSHDALTDLSVVYKRVKTYDSQMPRESLLIGFSEGRIVAMLYFMIQSLRCWVESESPIQTVRSRWKVAHS
jgi:hypothetical protein